MATSNSCIDTEVDRTAKLVYEEGKEYITPSHCLSLYREEVGWKEMKTSGPFHQSRYVWYPGGQDVQGFSQHLQWRTFCLFRLTEPVDVLFLSKGCVPKWLAEQGFN